MSIILYELNEVPWRVIDWYCNKRPHSNLKNLLAQSRNYTTHTKDQGELHPWSTWPTLHRGVYNFEHNILFLNQDKSKSNSWPPIWEILAQQGYKVGVFGSLQSYPIPSLPFEFYIPDTFAPLPHTFPSHYECFQRINLQQTKVDGGIVPNSIKMNWAMFLDLIYLFGTGLKLKTFSKLFTQLIDEFFNPAYKTRRPIFQAPFAFDVFWHALTHSKIDFATFFTNHVAGQMHRYWKNVFPEDFNIKNMTWDDDFKSDNVLYAMDFANEQIGKLVEYTSRCNGQLWIASSMGQQAIARDPYIGELRIIDIKKFASCFGFKKNFIDHLAMQPDFNFEFYSKSDLEIFINLVRPLQDGLGNPLFHRIRSEGKTLNLGLSQNHHFIYEKQVFSKDANEEEQKQYQLEDLGIEIIHRDPGTGYHQPEGILIQWGSGVIQDSSRQTIELINVKDFILEHFGISKTLAA